MAAARITLTLRVIVAIDILFISRRAAVDAHIAAGICRLP